MNNVIKGLAVPASIKKHNIYPIAEVTKIAAIIEANITNITRMINSNDFIAPP